MAKTTANISIDSDVKIKAQELFADLGMDLSTAINIFLRQAIRENAIPFEITRETPNDETKKAIEEVREMKKHPEQYKSYGSAQEMFDDILGDI